MFSEGTCDTCKLTTKVGVASLPFAPMSVAFCRKCLEEGAYPLWAIHGNIWCLDGPENVADWFKEVKSFKAGEYIGWDEIVKAYDPTIYDQPETDRT